MRTGLSCLLIASLIQAGLAVKFSGEKVKLGKAKCTCDFTIKPGPPCNGVAKCDKKCSGKGPVSLEGFEFNVQCKKGKCTISQCQAEAPVEPPVGSGSEPEPTGSGPEPPTGSGPEPLPVTGSGSGPVPLPPTGSGERPVPMTGSGSGPVTLPTTGSGSGPNMGEGMQCSCNCDCPDGGSNCECACNCPVKAKFLVCGSGFTKVCPMMDNTMCPDMMAAVCPNMAVPMTMGMEQTRKGMNRMSHEGEGKCQCVPDFLLAMVPGMPGPGDMVAGRSALTRAPEKATIQFGKLKCKCTVDCRCAKGSCAKSKISCDKKCSGAAKGVQIKGCGVLDAKATKGKVKISKCDCGGEEPTGTGSGSEPLPPTGSGPVPLPITGSGSGPVPLPITGSGSGPEPPMGSGPKCACVGV